jgi:outer membrane receptor for ferrienterochelin and colicins
MNKISILLILALLYSLTISAQKHRTDANIIGHVVCNGEHIPFATINIKGTTIGTSTDETGHYQMINLPVGKVTLLARSMGYQPLEIETELMAGETIEVHFEITEDALGLEEVVITGSRNETSRKESSTIVNTITPKMFETIQSPTLSEGLNFSPGLRIENNCQNCGFSQVRMNGMEGPYSQILINSRPIFSGLAGVYGLELIPSNMIERVEIIRGGGSALYGSNAIAGTINLILKDPINNSYEIGANSSLIGIGVDGSGNPAPDHIVNMNTSVVSNDNRTGMSLYGFYRNRQPFDANNDSFSEISKLNNTTIGGRLFHRFGTKNKLAIDFFNIKEERRGGDKFDYVVHETGIAEAVNHNITTGAISFDQFVGSSDLLSAFVSAQKVNRGSYYGANQSLSDYGSTEDFIYSAGVEYSANRNNSAWVFGLENNGEWLTDTKLGYPDLANATPDSIPHTANTIIADQRTNTFGAFAQYEYTRNRFNLSVGARYDYYVVEDRGYENEDKTGNVVSPRVTMKYDFRKYLQGRLSYSQGYRAPQIFDEDLHIETSGSRRVIHENDPDLKQETSHSYMASLDFNKALGSVYVGLLVEGFYTRLNDAFVNEIGLPDEDGTVIYTRTNAESGAAVQGVNIELNLVPSGKISMKGGFTFQQSAYEEPQDFNEKRFFRTPDNYGYFAIDWQPFEPFAVSGSATYTGSMLVPYFGPEIPDPGEGELKTSGTFFDMGIKFRYNIKLNGATLQLFTGIKNIFNSYQDDFDYGIDRDPGYIYGPMNPRTIYFGLKVGNMLNL